MSYRGILVAVVLTFVIAYTLVFQNPIFTADFNSPFGHSSPNLKVSPYLPSNSTIAWSTTGLTYACGSSGPGLLEVDNAGSQNATIISVVLTYNGQTYNATGAPCTVGPGNTEISITALAAPAGSPGSDYSGYLTTHGGAKYSFSGAWR